MRSFHAIPTIRVADPGSDKLIGEHTDYNEGFVLFPMAIPMGIVAVSRDTESGVFCEHTVGDQLPGPNTIVTFNTAHAIRKTSVQSKK